MGQARSAHLYQPRRIHNPQIRQFEVEHLQTRYFVQSSGARLCCCICPTLPLRSLQMPCEDYIDARIVVDGQPLKEYDDPDGETHVRYVQAIAGQHFAVQVKFLPGFKLQWAPYLYFQFWIDDDPVHYRLDPAPTTAGMAHKRGVLLAAQSYEGAGTPIKDDSGRWTRANFTFGALGIEESEASKDKMLLDKLNKLGRITMKIYRAQAKQRTDPYLCDGTLPEVLDSVPEKMMKGRHIKNNVRYTPGKGCTAPLMTTHDYVPVAGKAGKVYSWEFRYRNREILQYIGCIPRSPSPEPDHALIAARTEDMLKLAKEQQRRQNLEVLRSRQENERLRQASSRESSTTLIGDDSIKLEPPRGVKRERDDDDDLQELAPLQKRLVPTIELDDDNENAPHQGALRGIKREREEDDDELQELMPPPQKRMLILVDLTEDDRVHEEGTRCGKEENLCRCWQIVSQVPVVAWSCDVCVTRHTYT